MKAATLGGSKGERLLTGSVEMEKYIVFDIGGSHVKYGLITKAGEIVEKEQEKTPGTWEEMSALLDKIVEEYLPDISGVAVSAPGRIDVDAGVIYVGGALPYLHELNVKEYFKEKFDLPASVVNDGKAVGQAELWIGNLQGVQNGASIVLGTGIGGAVIVDGKVHQGTSFLAGEFSSILPFEEPLGEMLAWTNSSVRFVKRAAEILGLEDLSDGRAVFEVINSGENEELNEAFASYCKRLAIFICNLQAVLDISHVVIGGGISNQPIVIEEINRQYDKIRTEHPGLAGMFPAVKIDKCKFTSDSNLLGALYQLLLDLDEKILVESN